MRSLSTATEDNEIRTIIAERVKDGLRSQAEGHYAIAYALLQVANAWNNIGSFMREQEAKAERAQEQAQREHDARQEEIRARQR